MFQYARRQLAASAALWFIKSLCSPEKKNKENHGRKCMPQSDRILAVT
jgi:hypothetical protein